MALGMLGVLDYKGRDCSRAAAKVDRNAVQKQLFRDRMVDER